MIDGFSQETGGLFYTCQNDELLGLLAVCAIWQEIKMFNIRHWCLVVVVIMMTFLAAAVFFSFASQSIVD